MENPKYDRVLESFFQQVSFIGVVLLPVVLRLRLPSGGGRFVHNANSRDILLLSSERGQLFL
jgi:hypothetical protein